MAPDGIRRWADGDAGHRWFLQRSWGARRRYGFPGSEMVLWIGLNPSTADAHRDDATIRKMMGFSDRWGKTTMCVCNLFAERATQQKDLWAMQPAVADPRNLQAIRDVALSASVVVACWGAPPQRRAAADRRALAVQTVVELVTGECDQNLYCLGRTVYGQPRHPCRLGYDASLELFAPRVV